MSDNNNDVNTREKNNKFAPAKAVAQKLANKAAGFAGGVKEGIVRKKNEIVANNAERRDAAAERKKLDEFDRLSPLFEEDLTADTFRHEKLIRVVNYDPRLDNELCRDSIGFYEKTPNRMIPTIYTKYVENLGFSFFPHLSESFFIADPCKDGNFIEIDEYFNYMKQVRVNELTLIAQSLGARHVEIRLASENRQVAVANVDANADILKIGAKLKRNQQNEARNKVEIWASADFEPGLCTDGPTVPEVLYFKKENDIQTLIQMVLDNKNKLKKRTYCLKASSSSGMSMTEAANINASLKSIKVKAGLSFEKRANDE